MPRLFLLLLFVCCYVVDSVPEISSGNHYVGEWAISLLTLGARNQPQPNRNNTWYTTTLESFVVEICEEDRPQAKERYVLESDSRAARLEGSVDCIVTVDGNVELYETGYCEKLANCYWKSPEQDEYRSRRYSYEDYDPDAMKKYVYALIWQRALVSFIFAGVTLTGFLCMALSRWYCGMCLCEGEVDRNKTGYSRKEMWMPVMVHVFCFACATASAYVAYISHVYAAEGIGYVHEASREAPAGLSDVVSATVPALAEVLSSIDTTVADLRSERESMPWLGELSTGLSTRYTSWKEQYSDTVDVTVVEGYQLSLEAAALSAAEAAELPFVIIYDALDEDLVQRARSIEIATMSCLNSLKTLALGLDVFEEEYARFADYSEGNLEQPVLVLGLLVTVILSGSLGLVGLVLGIPRFRGCMSCVKLLHVTWTVVAVVSCVSFSVSGLSIALAVALSDACQFLGIISEYWVTLLDEQSASVMDACFDDSSGGSIATAFNLNTGGGLYSFASNFTDQNAGVQAIDIAGEFLELDRVIADAASYANSVSIAAGTAFAAEGEDSVLGYAEAMKARLGALPSSLQHLKDDGVFTSAMSFANSSSCGFVADNFRNAEMASCTIVTSSVAQIGLSVTLLGIFSALMAASAAIAVNRLQKEWSKNLGRVYGAETDGMVEM